MRGPAALAVSAVLVGTLTGCGLGLGELPLGRSADGSDYRVTAEFSRADRIRLGAEVRSGQQLVGRVHDLSTDGGLARVGLSLSRAVAVPADVTASIEVASALGDPYIRLDPPQTPSGDRLSDGAVITDTDIGPELESSLAALGLVLNGSGVGQLDTIVTELDTAFSGRGPQVGELLRSTDTILAAADAQRGEFDRVLQAARDVSAALADNRTVIDDGLAVSAPTIELLVQQRDRLASLLDNTASLATTARDILSDNGKQLEDGVDDIARVLSSVQGWNDSITPTLNEMNNFIAGFSGAVRGDYLAFDGALDLPETVGELTTGGRIADVPSALGQLLAPVLRGPR